MHSLVIKSNQIIKKIYNKIKVNRPVFHECQCSVKEGWVDLVSRPQKPVDLGRLLEGLQEQLVISLNLKPIGPY